MGIEGAKQSDKGGGQLFFPLNTPAGVQYGEMFSVPQEPLKGIQYLQHWVNVTLTPQHARNVLVFGTLENAEHGASQLLASNPSSRDEFFVQVNHLLQSLRFAQALLVRDLLPSALPEGRRYLTEFNAQRLSALCNCYSQAPEPLEGVTTPQEAVFQPLGREEIQQMTDAFAARFPNRVLTTLRGPVTLQKVLKEVTNALVHLENVACRYDGCAVTEHRVSVNDPEIVLVNQHIAAALSQIKPGHLGHTGSGKVSDGSKH